MLNRLKGVLYDLTSLAARAGSRKKTAPRLLIVRIDEIGDYILWRNFLKEIVSAEKFKDHEIHLCGNQSWKSLFNLFDSKLVDEVHWIDKQRFKKDLRYRFSYLRKIFLCHFDVVINPTFSRDLRNDDAIVKAAKAAYAIGMQANAENIKSYQKGYDTRLYDQLFTLQEKPIFEFLRNRLFTEFVTGAASSVPNTQIQADQLPVVEAPLPDKYFVVFPGSRHPSRIWPTGHFVTVSNYLYEQRGYTAVVCGAANDEPYTTAFCDQYRHPFINLSGKTSLPQLLSVLRGAQCLLSVDTGSVHLAAAVGCTVFGIFNGSQYKRFAPYPPAVAANFFAFYPEKVRAAIASSATVPSEYEFVIDIPYASVTTDQLIQKIKAWQASEVF